MEVTEFPYYTPHTSLMSVLHMMAYSSLELDAVCFTRLDIRQTTKLKQTNVKKEDNMKSSFPL